MQVIRSISEMQRTAHDLRAEGKRIGFVPTMGFLHEGHLSLIDLAREHADTVVVSIFVNPTQFGPNEDFENYPRDFDRDERLCKERGVDLIFYPSSDDMYASDRCIEVAANAMTDILCGASRPGHFQGVLTVVAKLFHIVQPHVAVFGQKDAQQLLLIERMVSDLNFPINMIPGPIVREESGLAMSSRNKYLSAEERADATLLYEALCKAQELAKAGEMDTQVILSAIKDILGSSDHIKLDYAETVDGKSLQRVSVLGPRTLIALAAWVGDTRLIDNIVIERPQ